MTFDRSSGNLLAIFNGMKDFGLADSKIVVFTSDHGFQLNEHGWLWRKHFQYDESIRVRLIVRLPDGGDTETVSNGIVWLVYLYPILTELAYLSNPKSELGDTTSEPPLRTSQSSWKIAAFSASRRVTELVLATIR